MYCIFSNTLFEQLNRRLYHRLFTRKFNTMAQPKSTTELYDIFQKMEKVVHGTKICEGNTWQNLIYQVVAACGAFTIVSAEQPIALNPENPTHRKTHKVDIYCQDDVNKRIFAFNSKGKSFNNTESQESLLHEYTVYKTAIQRQYPDYTVEYAVLKDEYSASDKKLGKYHFLSANGIPVYNTAQYLQDTFQISAVEIEARRKEIVIQTLRKRMVESGVSLIDLCELISSPIVLPIETEI